jgi:choline dehydrogenase-like flavoprotein
LAVTDCDWRHPLCDAFIEAAGDLGFPKNNDYNGASQAGAGYYQRKIYKGWRVSAATAFLRPAMKRRNVNVRANAQVTAIRFEGKRAIGVSYLQQGSGVAHEVAARRDIILSSGAANTPKLLQISGIGPASLLRKLGVPIVLDLRGVGDNLQDHYTTRMGSARKGRRDSEYDYQRPQASARNRAVVHRPPECARGVALDRLWILEITGGVRHPGHPDDVYPGQLHGRHTRAFSTGFPA